MTSEKNIKKTQLHSLHVNLGAKMVPFAGYEMPVQYPLGVMKEHLFTRQSAGLFDVSHMGQAFLEGLGEEDIASLLEELVPGNIQGLKPGGIRYSMLLNNEGNILDDLMVTRYAYSENTLYLVVNAGCKEEDFALIGKALEGRAKLNRLKDRALIAIQGPKAVEVLGRLVPELLDMAFMTAQNIDISGIHCFVSRSGYTGEDGFEISVPGDKAIELTETLLSFDEVEAIGLGARDSLRLEAGLCLYGHDIDITTTPIEGDLTWAIPKRRREEANFPGADIILNQLTNGVNRKRVGILPDGKAPAREHTIIQDLEGNKIGEITSGGFGPSHGAPVAMGYVDIDHAELGTLVNLMVRDKPMPAKIAAMPFVAKRFYKKPKI